jgi:hypothetical protein
MAVGTYSFVGAAFPILSLVSICTIAVLHAAGYLGAIGSIIVALTA